MEIDWRGRMILRKLEEGCTIRETEEAARRVAEERLAKDPAVIAARKALAAAQPALVPATPPALVRGKVDLPATA